MIFIGYYDLYDSKVKRHYTTSAVNKLKYMFYAFGQVYNEFDVFSCCKNIEEKFCLFPSEKRQDGMATLYFPLSWGGNNRLCDKLLRIWIVFNLFLFLIIHAKRGEHVYVYHSTGYQKSILWAKIIKGFKLILDVEEIYSDVQKSEKIRRMEYNYFEKADAYLFSTETLNKKLNLKSKPYLVINGTYNVEPILSDKFNDGKIHVVYAGTFDVRKGGAAAAVAAAEFLDEKYVIHICGFGNDNDTQSIKEVIEKTNSLSTAHVLYHGLLTGNDYITFLQKCNIGLSTQDPSAAFNSTSFPSKVLSYLSNGLAVVSIRIPAVEESRVGHCLYYYDSQTPKDIAHAIKSVDLNKDYRSFISKLASEYELDLKVFSDSLK